MRKHILLQKLNEEGQTHEIEFWQFFNVLLYMLFFVFDSLIVDELFIGLKEDHWLFQIAKEPFYETGYEVWVFNLLQILVVSPTKLVECLIFLIN